MKEMRKQRQQRLRDVELEERAHSAESDSGHGQTAGRRAFRLCVRLQVSG
jgi:hypothetical protein